MIGWKGIEKVEDIHLFFGDGVTGLDIDEYKRFDGDMGGNWVGTDVVHGASILYKALWHGSFPGESKITFYNFTMCGW